MSARVGVCFDVGLFHIVRRCIWTEASLGLIATSLNFIVGQDVGGGYPTVFRDIMRHGTLAASHLNLVLRCYDVCMLSPITGRKFEIGGDHLLHVCVALGSVCVCESAMFGHTSHGQARIHDI